MESLRLVITAASLEIFSTFIYLEMVLLVLYLSEGKFSRPSFLIIILTVCALQIYFFNIIVFMSKLRKKK